MLGTGGYSGSPSRRDGDADGDGVSSSSSSSDVEGPVAAAAEVGPSPTRTEDDVGWTTPHLSAGNSSSRQGRFKVPSVSLP